MNIKIIFLLTLVFSGCLNGWGQKSDNKAAFDAQQATIKKQIIVNDLENRIKDIPFAAVRIFMKYKIAAWLWKNGKDETERAAPIAADAIGELYERKSEIPDLYFNSLGSDIFALLELNAPDTSEKLAQKYNFDSHNYLNNANSLLNGKDGEKKAAENILKSLTEQKEFSSEMTLLMEELRSRRSTELTKILAAVVALEENGDNLSTENLFFVVDFFRGETVPNQLRIRFYKIIFGKIRNAIQFPDSDAVFAYDLISAVMRDIASNAPDLSPEASALQSALTSKVAQSRTEMQKIYERIEDSADRLEALIYEADSTENKALKKSLLTEAAQLALRKEKFRLAVDLAEKIKPDKEDKLFIRWYDQFLGEVAQSALKKSDEESAKYATGKISDKLTLAENLRKMATYYFEKQDATAAVGNLDEAVKITTNADNDSRKINSLIRLIYTTQKIDKTKTSEVAEKTAKAIDAMPTLNIDDKPETENYKKYVSSIMAININLLPVVESLMKNNRNEAVGFINRINRKEIKIAADYVLTIDSFKIETSKQTQKVRFN